MGTAGHLIVSVKVDAKPKISSELLFYRKILRCTNFNSFRFYMREACPLAVFKHTAFKTATLASKWIVSGMESLYTRKNPRKILNSQLGISLESAAAISHRKRY